MDSNLQNCTFLALLSIGLCVYSLILVALLSVEVSPIIVERGMRSVVCLTREVLLVTPNGALEQLIRLKSKSIVDNDPLANCVGQARPA